MELQIFSLNVFFFTADASCTFTEAYELLMKNIFTANYGHRFFDTVCSHDLSNSCMLEAGFYKNTLNSIDSRMLGRKVQIKEIKGTEPILQLKSLRSLRYRGKNLSIPVLHKD